MRRTTGTWLQCALLTSLLSLLVACRSADPLMELAKPADADLAAVRAYGDALLRVAHAAHPGSGFSAAIVTDEEILWSGTAGAMTGTGAEALAIAPDLPMHIGSITKLFTALAVMQLVEQGKLDLDANLRTYIPEFSVRSRFGGSDFTLRQMLTHYSGLPSDLLEDFSSDPAQTRALFASTVARTAQTHLKSRPDLAHSYSNLAYQLLGVVIERVSGEPYDEYIERHIFAPLQMTQSAVLVADANGAWPLTRPMADPRQYGYEPIGGLSAGGIVASLNDMARFAQMLLAEGEGIVAPESFREMQRVQDAHVTLGGGSQGLGFQLQFPPAVPQPGSGHSGALPGHFASLRFFPQQKLAIVVLETTDDLANNADLIGNNLRDVALEYVAPGSTRQQQAEVADLPPVAQSDAEARRYAGLYFAPSLGVVEVDNDDGELTLRPRFTRFAQARLRATGNDTFVPGLLVFGIIPAPASLVGLDGAQLHFVFDEDKRYITLAAHGGPPQALAASLEPGRLTLQWRRRLGTYQPADGRGVGLVSRVTLGLDRELGIPTVNARTTQGQQLGLLLELLSDTQAAIAGVGRYTGEVIEFVAEDAFVFEGTLFKRI